MKKEDNTTLVQAELSVRNVVKTLEWEAGSEAPEISDFLITDIPFFWGY